MSAGLVALTCPKCGASLPPREGAATVVCTYCHTAFEAPRTPMVLPRRGEVVRLGTYVPPEKKQGIGALTLLLLILAGMAVVCVGLVVIVRATDHVATPKAPPPVAERESFMPGSGGPLVVAEGKDE